MNSECNEEISLCGRQFSVYKILELEAKESSNGVRAAEANIGAATRLQ